MMTMIETRFLIRIRRTHMSFVWHTIGKKQLGHHINHLHKTLTSKKFEESFACKILLSIAYSIMSEWKYSAKGVKIC